MSLAEQLRPLTLIACHCVYTHMEVVLKLVIAQDDYSRPWTFISVRPQSTTFRTFTCVRSSRRSQFEVGNRQIGKLSARAGLTVTFCHLLSEAVWNCLICMLCSVSNCLLPSHSVRIRCILTPRSDVECWAMWRTVRWSPLQKTRTEQGLSFWEKNTHSSRTKSDDIGKNCLSLKGQLMGLE